MRAQMWNDVYVCLFIFLKPMACIFGGIAQSAPPPASKDNREYKTSPHTKVCEDFENEFNTKLQNLLKLYKRGIFRKAKLEKPQFTERK